MKIKTDFVTNSSSTSYVVFFPKSFETTGTEIREFIEKNYDIEDIFEDNDIQREQAIIDDILKGIDELKEGGVLYENDSFDSVEALPFNFAISTARKYGFILSSDDIGGGGGMSVIIGISLDKVLEIDNNFSKK